MTSLRLARTASWRGVRRALAEYVAMMILFSRMLFRGEPFQILCVEEQLIFIESEAKSVSHQTL